MGATGGLIAVAVFAVALYAEYLVQLFLWNQMWFGTSVHAIVAAILFVVLLLIWIWLDILAGVFVYAVADA
jgi:hypothetical protein